MAAMRLFWQSRIREAQTRFLYCAWVQKYYTKYIRPCQKRHASAIIPPLPRLVNMVHLSNSAKNSALSVSCAPSTDVSGYAPADSDEHAIDWEIACDCVKRANVVLGQCQEFFARKHTATHKPTSAQRLIRTTMTHTHTPACARTRTQTHTHAHTHTHIHPIIVSGAPRPMARWDNNHLWSPKAYDQTGQ